MAQCQEEGAASDFGHPKRYLSNLSLKSCTYFNTLAFKKPFQAAQGTVIASSGNFFTSFPQQLQKTTTVLSQAP